MSSSCSSEQRPAKAALRMSSSRRAAGFKTSLRERASGRALRYTRSTMPPPPPPPSGTVLRVDMSSQHSAEMSMGPFFVTRISNRTHQLTDPTRRNPTHGSTQPMDNYATARTEVHIADVIVVEWNSECGRRAPATDSYSDRRTVR